MVMRLDLRHVPQVYLIKLKVAIQKCLQKFSIHPFEPDQLEGSGDYCIV
jgi:hypothetical protein